MNKIRVSSLHNLDLDGKFCHAKHPRAEPCTSLLETHISIISAWSSSLATDLSSAGFCEKSEKRSKFLLLKNTKFCVCSVLLQSISDGNLLHPKKAAGFCWSILMEDTAGLSIPPSSAPLLSVWGCLVPFDSVDSTVCREEAFCEKLFVELKPTCLISSQID